MTFQVNQPYQYFADLSGEALEAGKIYIGTAGLDAEANPISIYWDEAGTLPATQPVRTLQGYPVNGGSAANIFASADYSITVRDVNDVLIFSRSSVVGPSNLLTTGQTFADSVKLNFGAGTDGSIYSDGTDPIIEARDGTTLRLKNANGEHLARFYTNGGIDFSHNNITKLQVTSGGISVTGDATVSAGGVFTGEVEAAALILTEAAAVSATPGTGQAEFWVQNTTPNKPKFTDDAGTDFDLATDASVEAQTDIAETYVSTGNAYTNGGTITKTHGLAARPYDLVVTAVCVTNDGIFVAGEEVLVPTFSNSGSNYYGASIRSSATEVIVQIGAQGLLLHNASGGISGVLTPANWTISVRARA